MGVTIGAMLEEIQGLYGQHHQPCFLYLSSEVIKVFEFFLALQNFNQICSFHFKQQLDLLPQIFGSDPSCANYLKVLIESLFSHTACLLTKIQVQSVALFCISPLVM